MKLNKFLLSLFIVPALAFVGCSDYEDSETVSPQADENVLGANFAAATKQIVVNPKKDKFELILNRVNTTAAATVAVKVVSCSDVTPGVKFCDQPTVFTFAAGEATAKVELKYDPACKFQKEYTLALSIGDGKDHIYAGGTSSIKVSFFIDYKWAELDKPVILEAGWYNAGILAPVEWAKDYEDTNNQKLCRIKGLYADAKIRADVVLGSNEKADEYTPVAPGDLMFWLDESYAPTGMFSNEDYDPTKVNTGKLQNEKTGNYFLMNVKDVAKSANVYTFTYDVFYKNGEVTTNKKVDVKSALNFDFKKPIEKIIEDDAKKAAQ